MSMSMAASAVGARPDYEYCPGSSENTVHPATIMLPLHRAAAGPRPRTGSVIEEIATTFIARIAEAEREGRLGGVEGLKLSLAGAEALGVGVASKGAAVGGEAVPRDQNRVGLPTSMSPWSVEIVTGTVPMRPSQK